MEQLSLRKFLLASIFTFMISMALVTFFLDSPLNAEEDKLVKIPSSASDDFGVMPMSLQQVNNNTNSTP